MPLAEVMHNLTASGMSVAFPWQVSHVQVLRLPASLSKCHLLFGGRCVWGPSPLPAFCCPRNHPPMVGIPGHDWGNTLLLHWLRHSWSSTAVAQCPSEVRSVGLLVAMLSCSSSYALLGLGLCSRTYSPLQSSYFPRGLGHLSDQPQEPWPSVQAPQVQYWGHRPLGVGSVLPCCRVSVFHCGAIAESEGHTQVTECSTHARPGMHMQQCSAVLLQRLEPLNCYHTNPGMYLYPAAAKTMFCQSQRI